MDEPRHIRVESSAEARLGAARAWLAEQPSSAEVLVLASHSLAADELVHSVVLAHGARFGIQRFTPNRLATHLAAPELARRNVLPCTSLSLTAVVTRATYRVVGEGHAGRWVAVAERPGFPTALARSFEDLRAAGVAGEALADSSTSGHLAPFVKAIEGELEETGSADRAEVYALAIASLREGRAPMVGWPVLLLDLDLDYPLEQRLVGALVSGALRVFATAARGDEAAIGALSRMLGVQATSTPERAVSSLGNLQTHLFEDTAPAPGELDETVSLASWPGEARECVEIARRMQVEAARGILFDRMAVLLRAPAIYRSHLEEALRRASIPAWFARGTTRPDPAGRALLALLACASEGLSARRFAEYLSLAQVPRPEEASEAVWRPPQSDLLPLTEGEGEGEERKSGADEEDPDAAVVAGTLRSPWRWERLLVNAAVVGGAARWRRRLEGLRREVEVQRAAMDGQDPRAAALDRTAGDLKHLRDFALPLVERLAALPRQAQWGEWLSGLQELATLALREPAGVMSVLAELNALAPVGPVDLATVEHVLVPKLRELRVPPEARPQGAAFIAPVELARGLSFDVVFVPGLAEKLFPQRILQDPLLPDAARAELGQGLATRATQVARERLALGLAVGCASRHLSLSWPRLEIENARARVPSFYVLEALRAAEGRLPGLDELAQRAEARSGAHLGWPAPERPEDAVDDAEYDLAVLAPLREAEQSESVGAAAYLLAANPHLARALRARGRRWLKRWTEADGLVNPGAEALEVLARHRLRTRAYSATALESFAACPYRFLLHAIHQLRPRESIEALEVIDPLTRGALIHEVQFRFLTRMRAAGRLPLESGVLGATLTELDSVVSEVAAEFQERLAPAIARVWEDGIEGMRMDLREWVRRAIAEGQEWMPKHFELAFGLSRHGRHSADPASTADPVPLLERVVLRGSIDLVERRADGMLRVTDYKTGKVRVLEGAVVAGGHTLQPALYALAAEALFRSPVAGGRLYYCTADGEYSERVVPLDEAARGHVRSALEVIERAVEGGFLPAAPAQDACNACNYRIVCGPLEPLRTGRKPRDALADLLALRDLP